MFGIRRKLSLRERLPLLATFVVLLVASVLAAPQIGSAKPASVKLFYVLPINPATAVGNMAGSWTETVHNCGPNETSTPCNVSSTIGLAVVRISIPAPFQTTDFAASITSASGHNWTATYNPSTHVVTAQASTGSDKLQSGESVQILFQATPSGSGCTTTGAQTFSTQAWGDFTFSDQFTVAPSTTNTTATPTVTISGCEAGPGQIVNGPNGQTEEVDGFQGHVIVSFGGPQADCGPTVDPTYGAQWMQYRAPNQVTITPVAGDYSAPGPKTSTSTFDQSLAGGDSSWYLVCYAVPTADHPTFKTRTGTDAGMQTIGGTNYYAGILPNCYDNSTAIPRDPPCVSQQSLTTGPGVVPSNWTPSSDKVVISIRVPQGDPLKH